MKKRENRMHKYYSLQRHKITVLKFTLRHLPTMSLKSKNRFWSKKKPVKMIKRLVNKYDMWSHHKFPGNADPSSLTRRKTLHVTVTAYEFVGIIPQWHRKDGILHHTSLLEKESRKLKQCGVVKELTNSQGSDKCCLSINESLWKYKWE